MLSPSAAAAMVRRATVEVLIEVGAAAATSAGIPSRELVVESVVVLFGDEVDALEAEFLSGVLVYHDISGGKRERMPTMTSSAIE